MGARTWVWYRDLSFTANDLNIILKAKDSHHWWLVRKPSVSVTVNGSPLQQAKSQEKLVVTHVTGEMAGLCVGR